MLVIMMKIEEQIRKNFNREVFFQKKNICRIQETIFQETIYESSMNL